VYISAAVAGLNSGYKRWSIEKTGGRGSSTSALRDVLVDPAIFIEAWTEILDRCDDHAWVQFLDVLPSEAHVNECALRCFLA
jgi:hypothetical protein